jgi:allantoicase
MDGWESRRRREPGHDWCIIKLAYPGIIRGVELDTACFTGNHAPRVSIQGAYIPGNRLNLPGAKERVERSGKGILGTKSSNDNILKAEQQCAQATSSWNEILKMTPLQPGYPDISKQRFLALNSSQQTPITHIRLNYYPDGGVARMKLFGDVSLNFATDLKGKYVDLAAASQGGKGIGCSNQHYGEPRNLVKPGRGVDMGDGWETARHPNRPAILKRNPTTGLVDTDLMDWAVIKLGAVAQSVDNIVVDTAHFRGNFPESCTVEGCYAPHAQDTIVCQPPNMGNIQWFPLLTRTRLLAHTEHSFSLSQGQLTGNGQQRVSHVRVSIYPDGGISRVRVFGVGAEPLSDVKSSL